MTSAEVPAPAPGAVRPAGVPREINAALARVRARNGAVVGSAFLVDSDHVVTCAHVVTSALGRRTQERPGEDDLVQVDFPLQAPGQVTQARVEVWCPVAPDDSGDVAVLSLVGPGPAGLSPVRLVAADELWGHHFRTFGFPRKHDHGVWATGVLRGAQAAGWVQMDGSASGYPVESGFSGGAVWDDELAGIVGMTVAADAQDHLRAAYLIPAGVLVQAWPVLAERAIAASPYRGLYPFRTQDAAVFFGREDLTARLVREVGRSPLVAVVGPSGSGKSSVVFAGLVPALLQEEGWVSATMRPSQASSPLHALAGALLPLLEPEQSETQRLVLTDPLAQLLSKGGLADVVTRVLARARAAHLLVVVDQFEEVFTRPPEAVGQFVQALVSVLPFQQDKRSRQLSIVLTMRADFLGEALRYPAMADALEGAVTTIGQMGRSQLRAVIEKPLPAGARYEPGLVERILDDVGEEPGSLPLLQFALTLLWDRQDRGVLTHAAYDELGRVDGALAAYAERVYRDELMPDEQEQARRLLGQLVRPTDVGVPVRRVARRDEMTDAQWELGQRLAATRLVVADRDPAGTESVELVHEALIGGWSRLHEWVDDDLAFRTWQEQLRTAMAGWEKVGRDPGGLLRGAPLAEAERWREERGEDLTDAEKHFITASCVQRGRGVRRLRITVAGLAALLVVSLVLGVVAFRASQRSEWQAEQAGSRSLVTHAEELAPHEPDTALLLAGAAHEMAPTPESRMLVTRLASERSGVDRLLGTDLGSVRGAVFSPADGSLVLLWDDAEVAFWDLQRGERAGSALEAPDGVGEAALSPDGDTVAFSSRNGDALWVWDRTTGALETAAASPEAYLTGITLSPDGRHIGTCGERGIDLWTRTPLQLHSSVDVRQVTEVEGGSCSVNFAPGGRLVYADGGEIVTWDVIGRREVARDRPALPVPGPGLPETGHLAIAPHGHSALYSNGSTWAWWDVDDRVVLTGEELRVDPSSVVASFSADGRRALLVSGIGAVVLVDMVERTSIGAVPSYGAGVGSLSPDGSTIVSPAGGGVLALCRVGGATGLPVTYVDQVVVRPSEVPEHGARTPAEGVVVHDMEGMTVTATSRDLTSTEPRPSAVTDDGRRLATTRGHPDQVDVVDLSAGAHEVVQLSPPHRGPVEFLAFDASGRFLTSADPSEVVIWDLDSRSRIGGVPSLDDGIQALALQRDGKRVAVAHLSGRAASYDAAGNLVRELPTADAELVQFSPDGRLLAVGGQRELSIWDTSSGRRLSRSVPTGGGSPVATFSADGRYLAASVIEGGTSVVRIWRVPDLEVVGSVSPYTGAWDFAFSPDGSALVVATDGAVFVETFDPSSAVSRICGMVERRLGEEEWREYAPGFEYNDPCE
ncbi:WD40 repeat [Geodermatophilus poikilotrophus]|uniref:WD40 repeat n=1 Tax=Geodermatophilus poikilotrophus TaxID=1333667 RepID=A0A1I0BGH2_9ACTN|nr:WD40 repeat [Geodermatophilus poikilotrophus]